MSDCIDPRAIRAGDLLAYVDGVAGPQVTSHVRACTCCSARVTELRSAQARLAMSLQRIYCPSADDLGAFHLGLLPPGEKLAVARHVRACSRCAHELAEFAAPSAGAAGLPAAPGRMAPTISMVRSALPLSLREPTFAPRGTTIRHRLYRATDMDILIGYRVETPQRGALSGVIIQTQQIPFSLAGVHVHLFREEGLIADETIDDLGHFHFAGIGPGVYDLTFDWRAQMVLITEIQCGEP